MFSDGTRKYNIIKHPAKLGTSLFYICGLKYIDCSNHLSTSSLFRELLLCVDKVSVKFINISIGFPGLNSMTERTD